MHALGPLPNTLYIVILPEAHSWPYWCLHLQTWSMPGRWPSLARTGGARGPLVLSNQAGHGNLQKWNNYKLTEWLKFSVLKLDRNGFDDIWCLLTS